MNLTEEQLEQVKTMSGLFLAPDEIAVLLDLKADEFIKEIVSRKGPVYGAYFLGKTESKKTIRENVIKMARHGSPQAEEMANKYIQEQEMEEKKYARKSGSY